MKKIVVGQTEMKILIDQPIKVVSLSTFLIIFRPSRVQRRI